MDMPGCKLLESMPWACGAAAMCWTPGPAHWGAVVWGAADLSYADDWSDKGVDEEAAGATENAVTFAGTTKTNGQTYQPKWQGPLSHARQPRLPRSCMFRPAPHPGAADSDGEALCCRETMGRLLERSGNGTSLPYMFTPGAGLVHRACCKGMVCRHGLRLRCRLDGSHRLHM